MKTKKIGVVGGCGHVGLPLSVMLASQRLNVNIYDVSQSAVDDLMLRGKASFQEEGMQFPLDLALHRKLLAASTDPSIIKDCDFVFYIVGTPLDRYLQPDFSQIDSAICSTKPFLSRDTIVVLRSTLFPGTTDRIADTLKGKVAGVVYAPERIAQGKAMEELARHPQILAGDKAQEVAEIFKTFTKHQVYLEPMEAELAKLFTNAYRYCQFALVNQLYVLAEEKGFDFYKIKRAMSLNYPRLNDMPNPGFAAGPCIMKDTMQLSAFADQRFTLGQASLWVNENMPDFIVKQLKQQYNLKDKTVGILGLTFKTNVDDTRDSLACKLKNLLKTKVKELKLTDPHLSNLNTLEEVLECDIVILGTPHSVYKNLKFNEGAHVVDIWNFFE